MTITGRHLNLALVLYAALSVFDWASTNWVVESGIAIEANPIMACVIEHGGWGVALLFKLAVVAGVAWIVRLSYKQGEKRLAWAAAGISLTGQTLALMFNAAQLARIMSHIGG